MKDYFQNLGENILDTFNAADLICILCNMQPIELDVDTAVPIGLIANELLTNALKYAFLAKKKGQIIISLAATDNADKYIFEVADNGIGKPENITPKGTGFGTELVNLLVKQLEGQLTVNSSNVTHITIQFKLCKPH